MTRDIFPQILTYADVGMSVRCQTDSQEGAKFQNIQHDEKEVQTLLEEEQSFPEKEFLNAEFVEEEGKTNVDSKEEFIHEIKGEKVSPKTEVNFDEDSKLKKHA